MARQPSGPSGFVHLHVRSAHSHLFGASRLEELIQAAQALGYHDLALTDRDGLYGSIAFYRQARAAGLKAILGVELIQPVGAPPTGACRASAAAKPAADASTGTFRRPACRARPHGAAPPAADATPRARAVCLARNLAGYRTICRLVTARHLDPAFDLAEALAADHEDIYILVPDAALLARLAGRLPPGRLWALLAEFGDRSTRLYGDGLVRAASKRGIPLVAGGAVAFHAPGRYAVHRTLRAIATRSTVADVPRRELAHPKAYLKGPAEMAALFRRHPEAAANAVRVAADCNLDLPMGRPVFPKADLPAGETAAAHLATLARAGLRERYRPPPPEAVRRLERELEVIARLGFADYFLILHAIVAWARARGTPCVARGSAAGSLTAYALGISAVDPLAYGLLFERFLNLERADRPDIDLDVCWRARDAVIDHIYEAYGNDRVAMIATHPTFKARSAFREAAKAHGLAPGEADRLSRRLPYASAASIRDAVLSFPECRDFPVDRPDVARVLGIAARLDGLPRHASVHVGGVVIADRRLTDYVPLEAAAKGVVITQYEAEAVEAMGLVKMDILAQRSLSILETAVREIEENHGIRVDPSAVADGDPRAAALLATGDTFGCFQIESPGMRGLLRMMGARGRMDVILGLSLIRPGPASSGMKERFVRRRRGIEPPEYLHPSLREVLGDTYGVMLYQEDVIRVAHAAAGFSLAEGDRLRKDLAKGAAPAALAAWRTRFVQGAVARGASRPDAETLWDRVAQFAAYSYCKAHAATYGEIAYRAVYLRARWPAEFAAAVLANQAGYYERRSYVEDARRHGVPILGPDVNASEVEPTSEVVAAPSPLTGEGRGEGETPVPLTLSPSREGRGDPARRRSAATPGATPVVGLRIGLMDVHELSERAMRQIVEERHARGPYRSVGDLLGRVRLSRQEAENLAMAGALDPLAANRPQALWQVHACLAGGVRPREGTLWAAPADPLDPAAPPLEDYSPLQKLRLEEAMLGGITPSAGPMSVYYDISDFGFRISDSTENNYSNGESHGNDDGNGERLGGALPDKRPAPPRQPRENGLARTCDLARHAGREVIVLGLVFAERRARTKTGEFMKFLSFEDPWGVVEAVLLPDAYQRLGGRITTRGPYRVTGTVEAHYGALALVVKDLASLAPGHASPGP